MSWPKTDDGLWYIFDGQILLPVEVSTGAPILMLRPTGGVGQAIPAVDRGDPGKHAELSETITFTELTYDDPTPAGASFTTLIPPTDDTAGVYKLNLALHAGAPGADGTASIEDVGWELFHMMLDVASGRQKTWAEKWKLHNALVLFNPAPVT